MQISNNTGLRRATADEHYRYFRARCNRCDPEPSGHSDLCPKCQHLRLQHFFGPSCVLPGAQIRIGVGKLAEIAIRRHTCNFCYSLCTAVSTQWKAQYDEDVFNYDVHVASETSVYLYRDLSKYIMAIDAHNRSCEVYLDIGAVGYNNPARAFPTINPTVSLDLVKSWVVDSMENSKNDHVNDDNTNPFPAGFMVIDVERGCIKLVDATPGFRYIALSYVWGQPKEGVDLLATMANITDLKRPGSLSQATLPATIWDSMTVCTALQVPHLWVDRLCIIQDKGEANKAHKMAQIKAMDQIYSLAALTICASGSPDPHHGLCGMHDMPRTFGQGHAKVGNIDIFVRLPSEWEWRSQAWWKRAWTYQELRLSPRALLFGPWETTLLDRKPYKTKFEDPWKLPQSGEFSMRDSGKGSPIDQYFNVVTSFNGRDLSSNTDIFNAFLGVFRHIFGSLDEFLYGLPKVDFDAALLWDVWTEGPEGQSQQPMRRELQGSDDIAIPSWSWASFRGYTAWIRPTSLAMPNMRTFPSVAKWNFVDETNGELRPIVACGSRETEDLSSIYPDWGTKYAWIAKAMGCIEGLPIEGLPNELRHLLDRVLGQLKSEVWDKWGTYKEYWEDVFISSALPGGSPWICDSDMEIQLAKEKPGRIILRAALAKATIQCDDRGCKVQGPDNKTAGILVAHHDCEELSGKEWSCVALSVCLALKKTFGAVVMSTDGAVEAEPGTTWEFQNLNK